MDRIKNIKFTRKLVIKLILLSPVIAIIVYAALIRPVQVRLEQKEFRAAETYLEEKKNEIEKLVGPADKVEKTNSCGYSSAKFSKGSLYCSSIFYIYHSAGDLNEANSMITKIADIGNTPLSGNNGIVNGFILDDSRKQELTQDLDRIKGMYCGIGYLYQNGGGEMKTTLICSKQSMTEMYPVIKR